MSNSLEITNLGKLKKAKIKLDGLSVFVGTNNTGKSYASRVLYSILSVADVDPQQEYQRVVADSLVSNTRNITIKFARKLNKGGAKRLIEEFHHKLDFLFFERSIENKELLPFYKSGTQGQERKLSAAKSYIKTTREMVERMLSHSEKVEKEFKLSSYKKELDDYYKELDGLVASLKKELKKADNYRYVIEKVFSGKFEDSLLHNFQARDLTSLLGDKTKDATIKIRFFEDDQISLRISNKGEIKDVKIDILKPELYSSVVYLESPIYLKIKRRLTGRRFDLHGRKESLQGIPRYVEELIEKINEETILKKEDKELQEQLTVEISRIIGGKIIKDKNNNELMFAVKGTPNSRLQEPISLHLTATGITQLGILGYLVENGIIRKGSVVFIDEPEAHLHPAWQEKIIEIVYGMYRQGIRVIVATHSPVIIQRLEIFEADRDATEEISPNFFEESGEFDSIPKTWDEMNDKAADSLEEPAADLYVHSVWKGSKKQ